MVLLPIPGFIRYQISPDGEVFDTRTEEFLTDRSQITMDTKVRLLYPNRTSRYRSILIARLILITHKPVSDVDLNVVWGPKFLNSNDTTVCVDNLDWDFGDYLPPIPLNSDEFHPVPGFIDTQINLNGVVVLSGKISKTGVQRDYAVASARLPSGKSVTVGRHRLMALTFLKHPIICGDLIVNHKNGTPAQDDIKNLEWVTYRGNMTHAHETDLVDNHIEVEVKDSVTGEVRPFFSIGAFSRKYKLSDREIKQLEFRMRIFGVVYNYRGFHIRTTQGKTPWDQIVIMDKYQGVAKEVSVKDTTTGETMNFLWFNKAAEFLRISQYRLRNKLRQSDEVTLGQYVVEYSSPSMLAGKSSLMVSV